MNGTELINDLATLWAGWRRQPRQSITSPTVLGKALGVVAAMSSYQRLTPNNSMDKPLAALAGIGAMAGLAIPPRDALEESRQEFGRGLGRALLSFSEADSAAILGWYSQMQPVKQVAVAQFFTGEPIDEVSEFLRNVDNRRRVDDILDAMMGYFAPERLRESLESTVTGLKQSLREHDQRLDTSIDQGAVLVDPGIGKAFMGILGKGMRAKVKSSHLEIKTNQGPVSIATAKIRNVFLQRRWFSRVDARISTTDGSTFEGKLLTKEIEVVYESSGALAKVECRSLGGIRAFKTDKEQGS